MTATEKLAELLKRKFPRRPKPHRTAPAWMPADLADAYKKIGAGTLIVAYYGRILSPAECKARKKLMDGVDKRGEWFGPTWMPFAEDAGGGMLCFDTKTKRIIFHDAPTTGEVPKVVAPTAAAWVKSVIAALAKVPDPPDPEEDDYIEEEQEARFEEVLRAAQIKVAKPVGKLTPRTDVPPPLPPPDTDIPKGIQLFCTFKEKKKHAIDGLYVGRGVGWVDGKMKMSGSGLPGIGDRRWPKSMHRLLFVWDRDERNQGQAGIVMMDAKRLEAFVTVDDTPEADRFVKTIDRMLKKLGFLFDVIDDPAHRRRVIKRFQGYIDG